jgi:hypothetical protein
MKVSLVIPINREVLQIRSLASKLSQKDGSSVQPMLPYNMRQDEREER